MAANRRLRLRSFHRLWGWVRHGTLRSWRGQQRSRPGRPGSFSRATTAAADYPGTKRRSHTDPRWGRSEESYGEDPYLNGTLATAYVRGLTGKDSSQWLSISMLKHFMANSNEDNRNGSSSNFDDRLLHEYYAKPFEMAIRDCQGRRDYGVL